jgi:hypothetical protein
MSLTIHYGLKMNENDFAVAREHVEALRRRALELPFERVDDIEPHFVDNEILKRGIAFATMPGEGCGSATFGLQRRDGGGYDWQSFCKTAYTKGDHLDFLRCHLTVIAMLDHAQTLGILHWVEDASGYWERRDWVDLLVQYRGCDLMPNELGAVSEGLFRWFGPLREKAAFVLQED